MDTRKRLPAKERGSYRAYLKDPNVSPSKLPRASLYRHKKNKEAAKKDKQIEQYPQDVHLNEEGPSTSNQLSEESNTDILCEDMLETEVQETEGVETEVPFLDQCTFDYPETAFWMTTLKKIKKQETKMTTMMMMMSFCWRKY